MWQEDQDGRAALGRNQFFDLVIEPGEIAEAVDRGATVGDRSGALRVSPIRLLDVGELYDRATAAARLGLDPARPAVLIQLGSGWNRDLASLVDAILQNLAERKGVPAGACRMADIKQRP